MICIPLKISNSSELIQKFKLAQVADLTEIYFDSIIDLNDSFLTQIWQIKKIPILYKIEESRKNLKLLKKYQPEFLDIDISYLKKNDVKKIKQDFPNSKIIVSHHNYKNTPTLKELIKIAKNISKTNADIIKIATNANSFNDSLTLLALTEKLSKKDKVIIIGMGKEGKITRLTGHLFGNFLTFASLETNLSTAAGQVLFQELKEYQNLIN